MLLDFLLAHTRVLKLNPQLHAPHLDLSLSFVFEYALIWLTVLDAVVAAPLKVVSSLPRILVARTQMRQVALNITICATARRSMVSKVSSQVSLSYSRSSRGRQSNVVV